MSDIGPALRGTLPAAPAGVRVDRVSADQRADNLGRRSVKGPAKVAGLELAIRTMDLTTLEGSDTAGRVRALCRKAIEPAPGLPSVAAVCVYPSMVSAARAAVEATAVQVASVATAFPSGLSPLPLKLEEVRHVVQLGADEIDMVIDRGSFLAGDFARVHDEVAAVKEACGSSRLKVILETGELGSYSNIRRASDLAMHAGADFIKTSTGKIAPAATPGTSLVMLEAIRDFYFLTGRRVGMKCAGGIRAAKQALHYLVMVRETLGNDWLTPELFRLGASSLLDDVLMQLKTQETGAYQAAEYFSKG